MDVYVLNRNFETLDIVDNYKSIIWTTRYFTNGDFELYLPVTDKNISLLKDDQYLVRDKDILSTDEGITYKNVMIIEKIQITTSIEEGNYLIVTGRCLKSLLARRIIWKQTTLTGRLEIALRRILIENAIEPAILERKIDNLQLGNIKGFSETLDRQVTYDNILDFTTEVCTAYGIGWDISIVNGKFIFEVYKGENRSYTQTINPYVVFSHDNDNLLSSNYQFDKTNYKNVALVAGEGEGLDRKTISIGDASGLDRYETYVDSRNSSTNNGEISDEDYYIALIEEGYETLNSDENSVAENIDGEVEPLANYQLGEDYFLGDIVEVINEYGIETTPRIIEIIESEDDTGSTTIPVFSTWEV